LIKSLSNRQPITPVAYRMNRQPITSVAYRMMKSLGNRQPTGSML
jgi:hypothetical protein